MSFRYSSFEQGLSHMDRSCGGGWMLTSSEMVFKVWCATQMHACWFPAWICPSPVVRLLMIHSCEPGSPLAQAGLLPRDCSCLFPSALFSMRRKTKKCSLALWLLPVHSTMKLESLVVEECVDILVCVEGNLLILKTFMKPSFRSSCFQFFCLEHC